MILNYDGYVDTTQSENRIHDLEKEINSMQGSFEEFRKENRKEVEETMAKFTAELSPKALERFNKPIGKLLEED